MTQFTINMAKGSAKDTPVFVDLSKVDSKSKGIGYQEGATEAEGRKQEALEKSDAAMANALEAIQKVAKQVTGTIETISSGENEKLPLSKVEFGFSIRLNEEGEAVVAKSGSEAHFNVKLTWGEDD